MHFEEKFGLGYKSTQGLVLVYGLFQNHTPSNAYLCKIFQKLRKIGCIGKQ